MKFRHKNMDKLGIWPIVTVPKKSLAGQIKHWDRNSPIIKKLDAWATASLWVVVSAIIITLIAKIIEVNFL